MGDLNVLLEGLRRGCLLTEGRPIAKAQWILTIPLKGAGVDIDLHVAPSSAISRYRTYDVGIAQKDGPPMEWVTISYESKGDRDWEAIPGSFSVVKTADIPLAVVKLVREWLSEQLPDPKYRKDFKSHRRA